MTTGERRKSAAAAAGFSAEGCSSNDSVKADSAAERAFLRMSSGTRRATLLFESVARC